MAKLNSCQLNLTKSDKICIMKGKMRMKAKKNWQAGRRYAKVQALMRGLEPFEESNFGGVVSEDKNKRAKEALQEFFEKFIVIKPDKKFREDMNFYLVNMMLFADALRQGQFAIACNELRTLNHNSEVLQQRIYLNLIALYNKYLGGNISMRNFFKVKEKKQQSEYLGGIKFDETIDLAQSWVNGKPKEEQIILLDYMMEVIKTAMCIGEKVGTFSGNERPRLETPFPTHYTSSDGTQKAFGTGEEIDIDLSSTDVYVRPWNKERTWQNILKIKQEEFKHDPSNHKADFYTGVDLCYISNGNHSINAGVYLKKGTIKANVIHIEQMFEHYDTDGYDWIELKTGRRFALEPDETPAILYALYKMKYELECR